VGGNNRNVGGFMNSRNVVSVSYMWTERFTTGTGFRLNAFLYEQARASDQQDRIEYRFTQDFRYLVQPTITAVLEYRFQYSDYFTALRDSHSHFILGGANFQFAERLAGNFRSGLEIREFTSSAGGGTKNSPFVSGGVDYQYGQNSSVTWTFRYGLEASSVTTRRDRETFRTGLNVIHEITPRISGLVGFNYSHDIYGPGLATSGFTDDNFYVSAGLRYSVNRNFAVEAIYLYREFLSGISIQNYSGSRFSLGMVYQF